MAVTPEKEPRFQFAVVGDADGEGADWPRQVREYESLGYDAVFLSDHVSQRLAPLPALAAAAAATERIRLGTFVLNADLRPLELATRDLATVDAISGGRLVVGLGAGWSHRDYELAGRDMPSGSERLRRLSAAVDRFRALAADSGWAPPLLLGGGRRRSLTLAGATADVVSVVPPLGPDGPDGFRGMTPDCVDTAVGWVRAAAAGRATQPQLNNVVWHCVLTPRPRSVQEAIGRSLGCDPELVPRLSGFLVGSAAQVADELRERRRRWGLSLVTVPAGAARDFAAVTAELRHADVL